MKDPATVPPETLLTMKQAASLMGVSEKYLRRKVQAGDIRTITWGKDRRIARWYLKEWQDREIHFPERRAEELLREEKIVKLVNSPKHNQGARYADQRS